MRGRRQPRRRPAQLPPRPPPRPAPAPPAPPGRHRRAPAGAAPASQTEEWHAAAQGRAGLLVGRERATAPAARGQVRAKLPCGLPASPALHVVGERGEHRPAPVRQRRDAPELAAEGDPEALTRAGEEVAGRIRSDSELRADLRRTSAPRAREARARDAVDRSGARPRGGASGAGRRGAWRARGRARGCRRARATPDPRPHPARVRRGAGPAEVSRGRVQVAGDVHAVGRRADTLEEAQEGLRHQILGSRRLPRERKAVPAQCRRLTGIQPRAPHARWCGPEARDLPLVVSRSTPHRLPSGGMPGTRF